MSYKKFNYSYGNDNGADSLALEAGTLLVNSNGFLVLHDGTTTGGNRVDTGSIHFDNSGNMYTGASNIDIYTDDGSPNYAEVWMLGNTHVSITADGETNSWLFKAGGNLQLPQGGMINEGTSPSGAGHSIILTPANGSDANQQLVMYPTITEGNHLHLTSGNLAVTSLFLGNDNQYVRTVEDGSITIGTNDTVPDSYGSGNRWNFGIDGALTFPDSTQQKFAPSIGVGPLNPWSTAFPNTGYTPGTDYMFFFDSGTGHPSMMSYSVNGGNPLYSSIWSVEYGSSGTTNPVFSSSGANPLNVDNVVPVSLVGAALTPGDYAVVRVQNLDTGKIYRATFMGSYNAADEGNETHYGSIIVERLI